MKTIKVHVHVQVGIIHVACFLYILVQHVLPSAWGFMTFEQTSRRPFLKAAVVAHHHTTYFQQQCLMNQQRTCLSSVFSSISDYDDANDEDEGEISQPPQQNWLESLKKEADKSTGRSSAVATGDQPESDFDIPSMEDDGEPGNVNIPSTGVSVSDSLVDSQRDEFKTSLVRLEGVPGVAKIETEANNGSIEPVRYLVALSPPTKKASKEEGSSSDDDEGKRDTQAPNPSSQLPNKFALVDVPPYSDKLAGKIRSFMGETGMLSAILVTNRDSVHYDESPAVYVTRKSDMAKWMVAFPGVKIVMYRLDIPRDCREVVSQRLDGYGPWALDEGSDGSNATFVETGRPLTVMEWDENTRVKVMDDGETPPDDDDAEEEGSANSSDDELYTPKAIREREEGKRVLAIYTPGRTFGSVSFVFPEVGVCCSGYSIPIEDNRAQENLGMSAGPKLDYTGYVTTSVAGVKRQVESATHLIKAYSDRFNAVLPANGETVVLGEDKNYRTELLLDIVSQYEKIGQIYDELGIM